MASLDVLFVMEGDKKGCFRSPPQLIRKDVFFCFFLSFLEISIFGVFIVRVMMHEERVTLVGILDSLFFFLLLLMFEGVSGDSQLHGCVVVAETFL